jgi:tight adherence protein B
MNALLILTLFFIAVFASVVLALWALRRSLPEDVVVTRDQDDDSASKLLREDRVSTITFWESLLGRFRFVATMRRQVEEANLSWSVGRLTAMMLLCGSVAAVLAGQVMIFPDIAKGALVIAFAFAPYVYVLRARERRFRSLAAQFPDALDSLSRALKAGHPFSACIFMLAAEQPDPISSEMRRCYDQWKLGGIWDQTLDDLARRVPIPEVAIFSSAVKMQNKSGGKLNEVLGNISESMRERVALDDEIRAISAHGRMTGTVLTILPVFIFVMMMVVSPQYIHMLLGYSYGKDLIAAAVGCVMLAHFVIRRMVDIKI